jgi:hypothetical protein
LDFVWGLVLLSLSPGGSEGGGLNKIPAPTWRRNKLIRRQNFRSLFSSCGVYTSLLGVFGFYSKLAGFGWALTDPDHGCCCPRRESKGEGEDPACVANFQKLMCTAVLH